MVTDWKTLRAELPDDVRARLDAKRNERRLGKAFAEVRRPCRPPSRMSQPGPA